MSALVNQYPDDLDAATLYAAAIMNTNPWDYWYRDSSPKPNTKIVLATLNSVIDRDPGHAGAHHYQNDCPSLLWVTSGHSQLCP